MSIVFNVAIAYFLGVFTFYVCIIDMLYFAFCILHVHCLVCVYQSYIQAIYLKIYTVIYEKSE